MKKETLYSLLFRYLHELAPLLLLFLLVSGVFGLITFLYGLPAEAVLYALGLCLVVLLAVLPFHAARWLKKHHMRRTVQLNLPLMLDQFPQPGTQAEKDLSDIANRLAQILDTERTARQTSEQESMDYYTTWVHQIKTPISSMKLLLEADDTEENHRLSAELFRIEQYVEMVLSYLRLGSSASDYLFRTYDLDSILKQAIHKYAPLFVQRRIRLVYAPVNISVLTDEKWLLFIIEQILSNSVKYTPSAGTVTITVTPDKVLQITDTGIGIAPEDLPRIFEKGFTGYNGRADKKASGLGLYLCKSAAERLSHRIWAESVPGQGTTISLDLSTAPLGVE